MLSWHRSRNEKSVSSGWHTLATPDFDGQWHTDYIEKVLCRACWSPIFWANGIRNEKNFLGAAICALDFDSPSTPLSWARDKFSEFNCIIGTTKSHQREKNGITCDRYRVVLWFNEAIMDLALYKHNMSALIAKYGADRACKDGARFFFPCVDIVESHGGENISVLPLQVVSQENTSLYGNTKRKYMSSLIDATPATENRNETMFKKGCSLFRTGLDYSVIEAKLRIISNGLPEHEFQRTLKRCQEYAKK